MKQRWLVAIIGLPLLLWVLIDFQFWTMVLVCLMSGIAAYELLHVAGKDVWWPVYSVTVLCAMSQVWEVYGYRSWRYFYFDVGMVPPGTGAPTPLRIFVVSWVLTVALFLLAVLTYGKDNAVSFSTVSAGIVGGFVFPMMYSCILLLRMHETFGRAYVLAPFFIAFAGDSLSMYFGMWFGKKKMAPHVSPNKTWAGFIGGPVGSALGMLLLGLIGSKWLGYGANYLLLALVGVVGNLFGQLGDLSMSLIKREAGVKDYSHLFLTHGGMLDRFDSTLFIAPAVYFFVSAGII